jgi:hypothetical protein
MLALTPSDHVNTWFKNTLYSRLDDKQKGAIIIVMQRLHDDDLCGFLLKNSHDWVVLNFPAIALKDEQIPIGDGRFIAPATSAHGGRRPVSTRSKSRASSGSTRA